MEIVWKFRENKENVSEQVKVLPIPFEKSQSKRKVFVDGSSDSI